MRTLLLALPLIVGLCSSPALASPDPAPTFEVFDVGASAAADIVSATPTGAPRIKPPAPTAYRITVMLISTASWLDLTVTKSINGTNVTKSGRLGTAELTAGQYYNFAFSAAAGLTYNLRLETTSRLGYLAVQEVPGAVMISLLERLEPAVLLAWVRTPPRIRVE